jgi:hypothetical protein
MKNIILKLSAIILALSFAACDSNKEAVTEESAVEATQEVAAQQAASENAAQAPAQEEVVSEEQQPAATQE